MLREFASILLGAPLDDTYSKVRSRYLLRWHSRRSYPAGDPDLRGLPSESMLLKSSGQWRATSLQLLFYVLYCTQARRYPTGAGRWASGLAVWCAGWLASGRGLRTGSYGVDFSDCTASVPYRYRTVPYHFISIDFYSGFFLQ